MTIGSILDNQYNFTILLIMLGVVNNKIINKGKNLNQKKKNIRYYRNLTILMLIIPKMLQLMSFFFAKLMTTQII